jgi:hypothetical protein
VPPEKREEAEATSAAAEDLVKASANDKPDKTRLRSLGQALLSTTKALGAAAPTALSIAGKVVDLISKVHSLG